MDTKTKLTDYLKAEGFTKAEKVSGENGAFISAIKADGTKTTYPVGGKSQSATIAEMFAFITDDGQMIATANTYKVTDSVTL